MVPAAAAAAQLAVDAAAPDFAAAVPVRYLSSAVAVVVVEVVLATVGDSTVVAFPDAIGAVDAVLEDSSIHNPSFPCRFRHFRISPMIRFCREKS